MARRGRFKHDYDDAPVRRIQSNPDAEASIRLELASRLTALLDELAGDVAATFDVHPDVARLMVAQYAHDATNFARWVAAGRARAGRIATRGLVDAMGFKSPTSITRMVPFIDQVAAVQAHVNDTGTPLPVTLDVHTMVIHPNGGMGVEEARKRGYVTDLEPDTDPA